MAALDFLFKITEFLLPFLRRKKHYLLVVEDDTNDVQLFINCLPDNCDCDVATTCEQAIGMLTSKRYTIVFIDCRMPLMPGHSLYRIVRDKWPNVNIVITPGELHDLSLFPAGDAITFIRKPPTSHALQWVLKHIRK